MDTKLDETKYYYNDSVHETRFTDYDIADEFKISSLLSVVQEGSTASAEELDIGYSFLWPRGWGFIVTNTYIETYKSIKTGEKLTVRTWPLPPKKVIFEREYEVYDEAGDKVAVALSRWCLFDIVNQRILSDACIPHVDVSKWSPVQAVEFKNWKLPVFEIEGEPVFTMTVRTSDCDRYRHMNNTKYADACMNCFDEEYILSHRISLFQITYEKQCKTGEVLSFHKKEISPDCYLILGSKQNGETFMRVKIGFAQK